MYTTTEVSLITWNVNIFRLRTNYSKKKKYIYIYKKTKLVCLILKRADILDILLYLSSLYCQKPLEFIYFLLHLRYISRM